MADYLYAANTSPYERYAQYQFVRDDGSIIVLQLGKSYELTAGEVARLSPRIVLVPSAAPENTPSQGIGSIAVQGALLDGQVPVWSVSRGAFIPGIGSGSMTIPRLTTMGHSYRAGVHLSGSASVQKANRATGKLAPLLGVPQSSEQSSNFAVDGAMLMRQDASQSGAWSQAVSLGGYNAFLNQFAQKRSAAPYLSPHGVIVCQFGANDIATMGGAGNFLSAYQEVLKLCISRARAGSVYDDGDATIAYSSQWAAFTNNSNVGTGAGAHSDTVNGETVTITVPSDFEGGAVAFAVIAGSGQHAQHAVTVDGVRRADLDFSSSIIDGLNPGGSSPYRAMCQRITELAAGGHTILIAVSSIAGGATFFDSWWIEASPPPLILLADQNLPIDYSAYVSPPHAPTDADVKAINGVNRDVAAMFTDGAVITDGIENLVPRTSAYWTADKLHPNERAEGVIASVWQLKIVAALTGATNVGLLGTA